MARTSKFSFGRKHAASTERLVPIPVKSPGTPGPPLSKAQRLLGTGGDLNIDFPKADDHTWIAPKLRKPSDAISVAISEPPVERKTTRRNMNNDWDMESKGGRRVQKKESTTHLGPGYNDWDSVSLDGRQHDGRRKSSTSRSHNEPYRGAKSGGPPSIMSTQEPPSRKRTGSSTTVPRSPLLQVDYVDDWGEPTENNNSETPFILIPEKEKEKVKKKPSRLDLSKLFPRGRKDSASTTASTPETALPMEGTSGGKSPGSVRNGRLRTQGSGTSLRRTGSRESGRSGISTQTAPARQRIHKNHTSGNDHINSLYDHYDREIEEEEPVPPLPFKKSSAPESIPESHAVEWQNPIRKSSHGQLLETPPRSTGSRRELSSKDSKSALSSRSQNNSIPTSWDTRSVASVSSRNTKTSGKSKNGSSILATVDLNKQSVLSFDSSSDEEEDVLLEPENVSNILDNPLLGFPAPPALPSPLLNFPAPPSAGPTGALPPIPTKAKDDAHRAKRNSAVSTHSKKSTKSTPEDSRTKKHYSKFHAIPPPPPIDARLSGPWAVSFPMPDALLDVNVFNKANAEPTSKPLRSTRSEHALQPTPPLSPTSVDFHQDPDRSSRFMAVTQQEEALLEALRQKRAHMRESKISEADSETSHADQTRRLSQSERRPSTRASRSRRRSSASTTRGRSTQHESVLLYLDDPIMETGEPEAVDDMDDFYFNSDDDNTPRASYQTAKQVEVAILQPAVYRRSKARAAPVTPPDASRISHGTGTFGDLKSLKRELRKEIRENGGMPPMVAGQEGLARQILGDDFEDEEGLDPAWGR